METILKMRDICKAHTKCFDGCPLYADGECLVCIPPANLSDEQLYLIDKALKEDEECQLVRSVKEMTDEEIQEILGKKGDENETSGKTC